MTIDIARAAATLRPLVVETPLLESPALNRAAGRRVLVKAEGLQRTGSFKYRGASYRIACLSPDERARGVIAFSSGNFAQALAHAGTQAGVKVTIVMPDDAPVAKREATKAYGAEVVLSQAGTRNREEAANDLAAKLATERGLTKLHPFDDPMVVAGQASAGVEIVAQARAMGVKLAAVASPVGGGGLIAGIALAVRQADANVAVYAVEPEGYDDMARSLASGERQRVQGSPKSLCDALQAAMPGAVPFAAARDIVRAGVAVGDTEVVAAMIAAFRDLKLVLEPSGAVALAAVLAGKVPGDGPVAVLASGANIALEDFRRLTA